MTASTAELPTTSTSATCTASRRDRALARLTGVDAARGVALLGMMAVHSLNESDAQGNPTWPFAVFGGRAAAGFAVLSGVGIAFMTGRRRVRRDDARATSAMLLTRAAIIGAIGLALGYTDATFAAVILPYYAVLFVLALTVVFLPTWAVGATGLLAAGGAPVLTHVLLPHLPVPTLDNPTVADLLHQPLALVSELAVTGEFPALSWVTYVCAGLVVGRLSLGRARTAAVLLVAGCATALAATGVSWLLLNRYGGLDAIRAAVPVSPLTVAQTSELLTLGGDGTVPTSTWWWLAVATPHTSTTPDLLGTTGSAVALLGLLLLAGHAPAAVPRRTVQVTLAPLAAAGSMTLTLYTAHIMFINSDYDTYSPATGYLLQAVTALLLGFCWRITAGRGPLESLVGAVAGAARRRADARTRSRDPDPEPRSPDPGCAPPTAPVPALSGSAPGR